MIYLKWSSQHGLRQERSEKTERLNHPACGRNQFAKSASVTGRDWMSAGVVPTWGTCVALAAEAWAKNVCFCCSDNWAGETILPSGPRNWIVVTGTIWKFVPGRKAPACGWPAVGAPGT
jgi:hypothetical protein